MAYQSRQPCLPPPVCVPQTSTQGTCGTSCVSQCNDTCAPPCSGGSLCGPYQTTQPCLPPPFCDHSGCTEAANVCASSCVSFCNVAREESCPASSVEVSSPTPCGTPPNQPLPTVGQPCLAENVEMHIPCVTLCASECSEEAMAPCRDTVLSYVTPGSTVTLEPCGIVTVKPSPVNVGECEEARESVFVGSYTPHFL